MRIFNSPSTYVQGPDALSRLAELVAPLGSKVFALTTTSGAALVGDAVRRSFEGAAAELTLFTFDGECAEGAIAQIAQTARTAEADMVVGLGGGKALDIAKALAHALGTPVALCPTAASTDAPTSTIAALYTDEGVFDRYLHLRRAPDMVIMDSAVIAAAPVRLTVAGMGDALATYYEARATAAANGSTTAGGVPTKAALALARLTHDILMADGVKAKVALDAGALTPAVENIIEANTLLSGLGFESGGLAAAHAVHNGLTLLPETRGALHGEKVAFGALVQLVLEDAPTTELEELMGFCLEVGLPVTLEELGVEDASREHLAPVAERACAPFDTMGNMPFAVTPAMVVDALRAADALGHYYHLAEA